MIGVQVLWQRNKDTIVASRRARCGMQAVTQALLPSQCPPHRIIQVVSLGSGQPAHPLAINDGRRLLISDPPLVHHLSSQYQIRPCPFPVRPQGDGVHGLFTSASLVRRWIG
jgi:hypothetical protein